MIETAIVIAFIGAGVVIISLIAKLCYSSKCNEIRCGNFYIKRDVASEQSIRHIDIK